MPAMPAYLLAARYALALYVLRASLVWLYVGVVSHTQRNCRLCYMVTQLTQTETRHLVLLHRCMAWDDSCCQLRIARPGQAGLGLGTQQQESKENK